MPETLKITSLNNVKKYGANLHINEKPTLTGKPLVIDVETISLADLSFVGFAIMELGSNDVYYFSNKKGLEFVTKDSKLIAHNAKFDMRVLRHWGIPITGKNIYLDTVLMSYVYNTTADTHHLKEIAQKFVGMKWPTFSEMVANPTDKWIEQKEEYVTFFRQQLKDPKWKPTPRGIVKYMQKAENVDMRSVTQLQDLAHLPIVRKLLFLRSKECTLNFQPVENVADYCGADVLATNKLVYYFLRHMTSDQRRILHTIEMPLLQILFDMENTGISIDVPRLQALENEYAFTIKTYIKELNGMLEGKVKELDYNSNKQVAEYLRKVKKFTLPKTKKGNYSVKGSVLEGFKGDPFIDKMLEYRRDTKMYSTFIMGLLNQETLPKVHTTFNQVVYHDDQKDDSAGISTNRLSSSNPNLQNIPRRKGAGEIIRSLFIPDPQHTMIVGDYSQIEYRLLAHFTKEPILLEAYKNGKDMHEEVGKLMGGDRDLGKSLNFAVVYGAGPTKVSSMAGCSSDEAQEFLNRYWKNLRKVVEWKDRTVALAHTNGGITTYLGRFIKLPGLRSYNLEERSHAERCAVNYTIQGSAAEIIKLAMIDVVKAGYLPRVQVHDELIFSEPVDHPDDVTKVVKKLKDIMESVITLDVPLVVDINAGKNWHEAK